jgi:hypothetical protein
MQPSSAAQRFIATAVSTTTAATYEKAWGDFIAFCAKQRVRSLPAHPVIVANFLSDLAVSKRSLSAVEKAAAAISHFHKCAFLSSPTLNEGVLRTLKGIRKELSKPSKQKDPMSSSLLQKALSVLSAYPQLPIYRTVWRVHITALGMLRHKEVNALFRRDIQLHEDYMIVHVAESKTDQAGRGVYKTIAACPSQPICPVRITIAYLQFLSSLTGADYEGSMQPTTAGHKLVPSKAICYKTALTDFKRLMHLLGEDPAAYGEHSNKRFGATAALEAGLTNEEQMYFGGWKSPSMPAHYAAKSLHLRMKLSRRVALSLNKV